MKRWGDMREAGVLLAALVGLASASCGSIEEDVCAAKCDCEGCSDFEFDDCVADLDDDFVDADRRGCDDEYDELVECLDATGVCRRDGFETDCGYEKSDFRSCMGDGDRDACFTDVDCDSGGRPHCSSFGACVECVVDAHCDSDKRCVGNKCD